MAKGAAALGQDAPHPVGQLRGPVQCKPRQQLQTAFLRDGVQGVRHLPGVAGVRVVAGLQARVAVADGCQNGAVRVIAFIEGMPPGVGLKFRTARQPLQGHDVRVAVGLVRVSVVVVHDGRAQTEPSRGVGHRAEGHDQSQRRRQQQRAAKGAPFGEFFRFGVRGRLFDGLKHPLPGRVTGTEAVISAIKGIASHIKHLPRSV